MTDPCNFKETISLLGLGLDLFSLSSNETTNTPAFTASASVSVTYRAKPNMVLKTVSSRPRIQASPLFALKNPSPPIYDI